MYLDRDFLETSEGFLFCVIGCVHPRDRVIAYLKYVLSQGGKWGQGERRFRRTMDVYSVPEVIKNVEMLRAQFPHYVFRSKVMNILMSAVPRKLIVHHYRPKARLSELYATQTRDELEQDVVDFVEMLSRNSSVDRGFFGVTGSILMKIHHAGFSDMDITVYGHENVVKVREAVLKEFQGRDSDIRRPRGEARETMLRHWARNYGLSQEEIEWFATRKWSRGVFHGRPFSLLPIHQPYEIMEEYGGRTYRSEGIVEGEARIGDTEDSLFLPCTYGLKEVEISHSVSDVEEIISYDGFYNNVFQIGEDIRFRGKLEKVTEKRTGRETRRILIGSPEGRGLDYIRPKLGHGS